MTEKKTEETEPAFAHHPGETEEQTADHVAALEAERAHFVAHDKADRVKAIDAELARLRGGSAKTTRLRGDA